MKVSLSMPTKGQPETLSQEEINEILEINKDIIMKAFETKEPSIDLDKVFNRISMKTEQTNKKLESIPIGELAYFL